MWRYIYFLRVNTEINIFFSFFFMKSVPKYDLLTNSESIGNIFPYNICLDFKKKKNFNATKPLSSTKSVTNVYKIEKRKAGLILHFEEPNIDEEMH